MTRLDGLVAALIEQGSTYLRKAELNLSYADMEELARRWLVEAAVRQERIEVQRREERAIRIRRQQQEEEREASRKYQQYELNRKWDELKKLQRYMETLPSRVHDGEMVDTGLVDVYSRELVLWIEHGGPSEELQELIYRREYDDDQRRQSERKIDEKYANKMASILERYADLMIEERAAEIGMEWTAELLVSSFALPDGTRVTRGEATAEQHLIRENMLKKNIVANGEAAARHQLARQEIVAAGVECLGEL